MKKTHSSSAVGSRSKLCLFLMASRASCLTSAISVLAAANSSELRAVLDELKAEHAKSKVANISGHVFTRDGSNKRYAYKPIRSIKAAFRSAKKKAAILDLRPHDFRHTAITNWSAEGIPQQAVMAAAGHHSIKQSNDYTNLKDEHLKRAFSSTGIKQDKSA